MSHISRYPSAASMPLPQEKSEMASGGQAIAGVERSATARTGRNFMLCDLARSVLGSGSGGLLIACCLAVGIVGIASHVLLHEAQIDVRDFSAFDAGKF